MIDARILREDPALTLHVTPVLAPRLDIYTRALVALRHAAGGARAATG